MKLEKDFYRKMDGIHAILALSKFHKCTDVTKGMAIDRLARYIGMGRTNSFEIGVIAFYYVFDKQLLKGYLENPEENDLLRIHSVIIPDHEISIEAVRGVVVDGYLMKYLKLVEID